MNPEALFLCQLRDLFSAEHQLARALPRMAAATVHEDFKAGLNSTLVVTKQHVERLTRIRKDLGVSLSGQTCAVTADLIKEGNALIGDHAADTTRDRGLIGAAQRVENYEIAGYIAAKSLATHLGLDEAANLLSEILAEKWADESRLIQLAESGVN
jgi:ferritin-like metal-binding protein YciE